MQSGAYSIHVHWNNHRITKVVLTLLSFLLSSSVAASTTNSTALWLQHRNDLIHEVFGYGPGILTNKSVPDWVVEYNDTNNLTGLVWNLQSNPHNFFPINSTVFYSPVTSDHRSRDALFFHHGHSNCICPGETALEQAQCRPGCNSSMPSGQELNMAGYSWWDLYNTSEFAHSLGYDIFIFSMPLKGINLGPGSTDSHVNSDHWWFLQWEKLGDHPLRYFLEPVVLTANYAEKKGYENIVMAGLSGGGWSTTFASAIDKRIKASFPIAGSVPCDLRNPLGKVPNQTWTGNDDEDYEQSCMPPNHPVGAGNDKPGRTAFVACNYTCQYLLACLEEDRFQVQILHEYDSCCFSPYTRHEAMLNYESNVRTELQAADRQHGKHGWFTSTADNHTKHEVCAQDKTLISEALAGMFRPGSPKWDTLNCDILHQSLPGGNCTQNVEPGYTAKMQLALVNH